MRDWDIWRVRGDGWDELVCTIRARTASGALAQARRLGVTGTLYAD